MSVDDALMKTDFDDGAERRRAAAPAATRTSLGEVFAERPEGEASEPDLDAARGLLPAILMGVALWGVAFALAAYFWR
jgi:hypothetical protein